MVDALELHDETRLRFENHRPQPFKPVEIAIKRNKLGAVLDRKRGQVRVTSQIACGAERLKEDSQNCCMIVARMNHNGMLRAQPIFEQSERVSYLKRLEQQTVPSGKANKRKQRHPCKPDCLCA